MEIICLNYRLTFHLICALCVCCVECIIDSKSVFHVLAFPIMFWHSEHQRSLFSLLSLYLILIFVLTLPIIRSMHKSFHCYWCVCASTNGRYYEWTKRTGKCENTHSSKEQTSNHIASCHTSKPFHKILDKIFSTCARNSNSTWVECSLHVFCTRTFLLFLSIWLKFEIYVKQKY